MVESLQTRCKRLHDETCSAQQRYPTSAKIACILMHSELLTAIKNLSKAFFDKAGEFLLGFRVASEGAGRYMNCRDNVEVSRYMMTKCLDPDIALASPDL